MASTYPIFVRELKRLFLGGRSRTSSTLIIRRSAAHPVTTPHLTLVLSLAVSTGGTIKVHPSSSRPAVVCQEALVLGESVEETSEDESAQEAPATHVQEVPVTQTQEAPVTHMWDGSGAPLLQGMPARVEVVAGDTQLGAVSIEVDGIEPQPDDAIGGPCLDLVMRYSSPSMPERTTPGNAILVPGAVDLGVAGLWLLGSPSSLHDIPSFRPKPNMHRMCSQ
jgi:hypothetical protein